jgi:phosphoglycolate phosphatase
VSGDRPHQAHPAPLLPASLLSLARLCLSRRRSRDAQAARAAGMRFAAAGWGYLGEGADPRTWEAEAVISRPNEILKLIP